MSTRNRLLFLIPGTQKTRNRTIQLPNVNEILFALEYLILLSVEPSKD